MRLAPPSISDPGKSWDTLSPEAGINPLRRVHRVTGSTRSHLGYLGHK